MRNLCSCLWTTQGRDLDHYKEMIEDIVTERVNTSTASLNRQAAAVIEWFSSGARAPRPSALRWVGVRVGRTACARPSALCWVGERAGRTACARPSALRWVG
eukprot:3340129-Prymnesium_polylepis.1